MKTLRTFALLTSAAVLMGLGGCASTVSKERVLQLHPVGESKIFVVVPGAPKNLAVIKDYEKMCGKWELPDNADSSVNKWMSENVCPDLFKWQSTSGVYHTKVWGTSGLKSMPALAPISMQIEENDILEYSILISPEGRVLRPAIVTRIARKAKDATKESGCYWDGGKGATTAFIGGGAVCDGWNWRDQKFAKE